jgi:hypothetical protein
LEAVTADGVGVAKLFNEPNKHALGVSVQNQFIPAPARLDHFNKIGQPIVVSD